MSEKSKRGTVQSRRENPEAGELEFYGILPNHCTGLAARPSTGRQIFMRQVRALAAVTSYRSS